MKLIWETIARFWCWVTGRPAPLTAIHLEELPDALHASKVYIIGEGEYQWIAAMIFPCGCGATLQLGLMPEQRPRWKVTEHRNGSVSLHPPVWRLRGCRSHFWLKHGKIIWCLAETNEF